MNKKENKEKNSWQFFGNHNVTNFLLKSIKKRNIANTYVFLGSENLGKTTIAKYFAKSLLCFNNRSLPCEDCLSCSHVDNGIHGDLHIVEKEDDKKNISIEQIRDFIKILGMSSFLGKYKIGIIKNAELLSDKAANSLLKTLEEPKNNVVIILIVSNSKNIPATILSRSQVLNFYPIKSNLIYDYLITKYNLSRSLAKNLSHLSLGRLVLAVKYFEDSSYYENYLEKIKIFLNFFTQDINARLEEIEKIMRVKSFGVEASANTLKTIEAWQGLIRDLILLSIGQDNLIQHEIFKSKLILIKNKYDQNKMLDMLKILEKAKMHINANVGAKLVLENVAINII